MSVSRVTIELDGAYVGLIGLCAAVFIIPIQLKGRITNNFWRSTQFFLEAVLILTLGWITLRLLNHLAMTIAFPRQDWLLITWDGYLGSPWLSYFDFVYHHAWLREAMDISYSSLTRVSTFGLFTLLILGQYDRAHFFVVAFLYTAIVATILGAFFPALAAVYSLVPDISQYQEFGKVPGIYHIQYLQKLRVPTGEIVIFLDRMPGLVTFPSFHTAAGIILIGAFWRTLLFVPVLLYSSLMIASTPVFGGHYFIDLVAGVILAIIVMRFSRRSLPRKVPKSSIWGAEISLTKPNP